MKDFIWLMLISGCCGIATFIYVEAIAFKDDKSGVSGFIWGAIFSVLVASIVGMIEIVIMLNVR